MVDIFKLGSLNHVGHIEIIAEDVTNCFGSQPSDLWKKMLIFALMWTLIMTGHQYIEELKWLWNNYCVSCYYIQSTIQQYNFYILQFPCNLLSCQTESIMV